MRLIEINGDTELAVRIMYAMPVRKGGTGTIPADEMALMLLINSEVTMTVGEIGEEFGLSQASTSDLISRAIDNDRVVNLKNVNDHRLHMIGMTPKGKLELSRARRCREDSTGEDE